MQVTKSKRDIQTYGTTTEVQLFPTAMKWNKKWWHFNTITMPPVVRVQLLNVDLEEQLCEEFCHQNYLRQSAAPFLVFFFFFLPRNLTQTSKSDLDAAKVKITLILHVLHILVHFHSSVVLNGIFVRENKNVKYRLILIQNWARLEKIVCP